MNRTGGILNLTPGSGGQSIAVGATEPERLFHALWSGLIALALALPMLLEPIDWTVWTLQSRLHVREPSKDVVYIGIGREFDADSGEARRDIARALDALRAAGTKSVFVDAPFEHASDPEPDRALALAARKWGANLAFVDRIEIDETGATRQTRTLDALAATNLRVVQPVSTQWPSFTWSMPFAYQVEGGQVPSFAAALATAGGGPDRHFRIDYGIHRSTIPTIALSDVAGRESGDVARGLAGKIVVIGFNEGAVPSDLHVPGQLRAPPSHVAIQAAETLKRGGLIYVPGLAVVLFLGFSLALATGVERRIGRRAAYVLVAGLPLVGLLTASSLKLQIEFSYAIPLFLAFLVLRSRSNWKQWVAQIDPDTGLPTLRAYGLRLSRQTETGGHVVVAKIHGYEAIQKTLDRAQRAAYVRKLVERLRVADPGLTVYIDSHYLAWRVDHDDERRLRGHLEGLRAIFAAPVSVGGHSIDVGITFGAARIDPAQQSHSLAAALAVVEETSEALEPVKLAQETPEGDSLWDLSLRARIDAAMEAGEVFCVYQPKMDIAADRIIGVEALVRWEDPERGFIPPLHFVMQCEKAGRMEYLTRYVLQSACSAARLLHFRGSRITMSVNISATLLSDMRIVGIVRNVLQATDFDPHYLMLEITETARIRDLTQARSVLKALKALGTHLSMDDFGVGAANFEALQALPFDEIKIDRQFVSGAGPSSKARAIAASIVGLGTSTRIAVVAEGAETESDLQMLRDIGCWQVQGYALARPMPLTNLLTFIEAQQESVHSTAT